MSSAPDTIRLAPEDNVVIARRDLRAGTPLAAEGLAVPGPIPAGHKLATRALAPGEAVRRYGQVIGFATAPIAPGEHVHVHNCGVADFERAPERNPAAGPAAPGAPRDPQAGPRTFEGFRRPSGRTGTRNYLGIVSSVNCSTSVARFIAEEAQRRGLITDHPGIDGVVALVHGTGCGMADRGEAYELLRRTLWGYARHPNFAGVLFVGLGCEVLQLARFKAESGLAEHPLLRTFTVQESGGTRRAVEAGLGALAGMLPEAGAARRTTVPASELTLALQCGGSDAYSGVTANPALGAAADLLVAEGGTAILSETPEIYGAEHLLTGRAASPQVAARLMDRIRWWEAYTARHGMEMNNNPSPGNKEGGLTTILEKSLGAVAKGGTTALQGVFEYAEPVTARGLVFMDSPGYDPCSVTGQIASGANLVCFTTGRGSAFGSKPVPTLKLTTTTDLFERMPDDMDLDCGDILDGVPIAHKGRQILDRLLATASGEPTRSELLGYGDHEFVPWQLGATM